MLAMSTDMVKVLIGYGSFNQPLNVGHVSSVTNMTYMFGNAESFNQDINNWMLVVL